MPKLSVAQLFGDGGAIYPSLLAPIMEEAIGAPYPFMDMSAFQALPLEQMNKVYWEEMLYRAHWAAISNFIRYIRWFDACVTLSVNTPNYPAFCAALRGLTEAAADTRYSLGSVPETLASDSSHILEALTGKSATMVVNRGLEDMLIHFQFARNLKNGQAALGTHKAESTAKYIFVIDHEDYPVKDLYSELCQVVHPAAQSLSWFTDVGSDGVKIVWPDDSEAILDLCSRHRESIEWIQQQSANIGIFILQALNAFPLSSLHTKSTANIRMRSINLYNKIKAAFARNNIDWDA
jgi:hypothetical protein